MRGIPTAIRLVFFITFLMKVMKSNPPSEEASSMDVGKDSSDRGMVRRAAAERLKSGLIYQGFDPVFKNF